MRRSAATLTSAALRRPMARSAKPRNSGQRFRRPPPRSSTRRPPMRSPSPSLRTRPRRSRSPAAIPIRRRSRCPTRSPRAPLTAPCRAPRQNLTYTPANGYTGADSFQFTDNNGTKSSTPATVTINVTAAAPSGSLAGSSTTAASSYNLTTLGTSDLGGVRRQRALPAPSITKPPVVRRSAISPPSAAARSADTRMTPAIARSRGPTARR